MKRIFLSLFGGVLIIAALFLCGATLETQFQMERAGDALIRTSLAPFLLVEYFLPPEHSDNPNPAPYDHRIRVVGMLVGLCLNVAIYSLPVYFSLLWLARRKRLA